MDSSQCDAWTRRRLGLTAGGFATSLLGLLHHAETDAKKGKKKRKKRCRKIERLCKRGNKKKRCCKGLTCDTSESHGPGTFCCHDYQQPCSDFGEECCRDLACGEIDGLSGLRCCGGNDTECEVDEDCCLGRECNQDSGLCQSIT